MKVIASAGLWNGHFGTTEIILDSTFLVSSPALLSWNLCGVEAMDLYL